jgi:hypothetical protein
LSFVKRRAALWFARAGAGVCYGLFPHAATTCCKSSALRVESCTNSVTHCKQGSFEWHVASIAGRGVFSQSVFRWTWKHRAQLSALLVLLLHKSQVKKHQGTSLSRQLITITIPFSSTSTKSGRRTIRFAIPIELRYRSKLRSSFWTICGRYRIGGLINDAISMTYKNRQGGGNGEAFASV